MKTINYTKFKDELLKNGWVEYNTGMLRFNANDGRVFIFILYALTITAYYNLTPQSGFTYIATAKSPKKVFKIIDLLTDEN